MDLNIFHIFRNTPLGKETLRQAADFTKKTNSTLNVYIPEFDRFMLYFDEAPVEVKLDESYLYSPETAFSNMQKVLDELGVVAKMVHSKTKTGSNLPDIEPNFDVISLPRAMTETKGGLLGFSIGSGVRSLVKASHAPAIIGPRRFAEWFRIWVFFGGSRHSIKALKWGAIIARRLHYPLTVVTLLEGDKNESFYRNLLHECGCDETSFHEWKFWKDEPFINVMNQIPRDALVIMGAYGHKAIRAKIMGSKTEMIVKNNANLLMLIGENCREPEV